VAIAIAELVAGLQSQDPQERLLARPGSAQVEILAVDVAAGHACVAEAGLKVADHAGRAAQEDGEGVRACVSAGQDALGGEVPLAAAVGEVDVHQVAAIRECPYFRRVGRVGAGGGVEEIDAAT
jgi:hypothetical protein